MKFYERSKIYLTNYTNQVFNKDQGSDMIIVKTVRPLLSSRNGGNDDDEYDPDEGR